jgi:hypothetical protein
MGHILPFQPFPTTALQHPSYPRTVALFSTFHFPNSWLCMASWTGRTPFPPAYQHQRAPLPLAALRTKLLSSIAGFVTPILASHPRHSFPTRPSISVQPAMRVPSTQHPSLRLAPRACSSTGAPSSSQTLATISPDAHARHQDSIEALASEVATDMVPARHLMAPSNNPVFRQAPPWKDFVRVHTVDLEGASVKHAVRPACPDLSIPINRESQGELSAENNPPVNIPYEYPPHQPQEHSSGAAHARGSVLPEVQASNFKAACVLGIGPRGKVLLARHKGSSAPCALK